MKKLIWVALISIAVSCLYAQRVPFIFITEKIGDTQDAVIKSLWQKNVPVMNEDGDTIPPNSTFGDTMALLVNKFMIHDGLIDVDYWFTDEGHKTLTGVAFSATEPNSTIGKEIEKTYVAYLNKIYNPPKKIVYDSKDPNWRLWKWQWDAGGGISVCYYTVFNNGGYSYSVSWGTDSYYKTVDGQYTVKKN